MKNNTDKKANTIKLYFLAWKDHLENNWITTPTTFSTNLEDLLPYFNSNVQVILQIEAKAVDTANLMSKPGNQ